MPKRKLTDDQVLAAQDRCMAGEKQKDVAAELGVHAACLRSRAVALGLAELKRGKRSKLTDDQVREAHARYVAGAKQIDVAADLGVPPSTLRLSFERMGLPMPQRGKRSKLTEDQVREAHARCVSGEKQTDVAAELGVACSTLTYLRKTMGLPKLPTKRVETERVIEHDPVEPIEAGELTPAEIAAIEANEAAEAEAEQGELWNG